MERKKNTYVGRSCAHTSSLSHEKKTASRVKVRCRKEAVTKLFTEHNKNKNMLRKTSSIFCKEKRMMNTG
jgi:hypothetical protein